MSSLEKELFLSKLPSRPPMPAGLQPGSKMRMGPGRKRDFSPVPWNHYFETMEDVTIADGTNEDSFRIYKSGSDGPVLLLLHGGGHSALSWAVFTSMIISRVHCRVVAVDLRSHGDTKVKNTDDLSAETMSSVKSGQIRNIESAKVSMVGQVKLCEDDSNTSGGSQSVVDTAINEEEEEEEVEEGIVKKEKEPEPSKTIKVSKTEYTWRIELSKTEKYWEGWFKGLSNLFLSCPIPKLLLLAGVDRLDRDLTIGQMQGKFQMQVLPQCGHAVHEDAPDKVAEAVATFMVRNKFTETKGEIQSTYPNF
ncbi:protein phosphatase methylesterase 1 isoform X2 [Mustelus asterias]